jgi:hypothetical protein
LNNSQNYSEDVIQTAYEKIIDSTKFSSIDIKTETINDCIKNIKESKASLVFLKILTAIFE